MAHLVLTRKSGEEIDVHTAEGVVTIRVESAAGQVKLGIIAPKGIKILRGEVKPHKEEGRAA